MKFLDRTKYQSFIGDPNGSNFRNLTKHFKKNPLTTNGVEYKTLNEKNNQISFGTAIMKLAEKQICTGKSFSYTYLFGVQNLFSSARLIKPDRYPEWRCEYVQES